MVSSPSLWGSQSWWDPPAPGYTWIVVTAHSLPLRTPNHDLRPTSPPWCTLSYNRKGFAEFSDNFLKLLACEKYKGTHGKAGEIYCVCVRERALRHCGLPGNCMLYFCRSATSITVAVGRTCVSRVPCNLWRKVCAFGEGNPASVFAEFCELERNNGHLWKTPVLGKQREDLISTTSSPSGCLLWKHLEKGSEALGDWDFEVQEEGNSQLQLNSDSREE